MKRLCVFLLVTMGLLSSCHIMENLSTEEDIQQMYFNETIVTIKVGGLGYGYITVNPSSVLEYNTIEYSSSNESVVMLYNTSNNGVVFSGKSAGVAVITAKLKDTETKMAVTVEE